MTTTRPAKVARIGELVGAKYRIVRMLAEGGMGVVYEAQHTVVRRRFAVKFLRPDLAERRDILNRFQREAEAAGALESEHVAAAVDFGIAPDGTPYIVMEYLVGESVAVLLEREGRLPVTRAADLASQASRGIQVAHLSGIIHRDLKPQNLFVCRRQDGTDLLKILDFGVAKLQAIDEMNASTRTGTVLGTVAYMSPEQARGDKVVDQRSDVYALGAILYELVSRRKPHPGESHNAVLHHISTHPAVPLESVQPGLPEAFVAIVGRALSSDPCARPPSAEALAEALAPFAERCVWAAPKLEDSGPTRAEVSSTLLAPADPARAMPPASSLAALTVDDHGGGSAPTLTPTPAPGAAPRSVVRLRPMVALGAALAVGLVVVVGVGRQRSTVARPASGGEAAKPTEVAQRTPTAPSAAATSPGAVAPAVIPPESGPVKMSGVVPANLGPLPAAGPGRIELARAVRRHASPQRMSASGETSPASLPGSPPPVRKSRSVPVNFDQENPYNK
jgi:eukaryotic-like serine/threonine-protein kinase